MKTLFEAVRTCGGVWPQRDLTDLGIFRGWIGRSDREPDYIILDDGNSRFTRQDFEAEARRQGYVEGFEGHPDDAAFKNQWDGAGKPPVGFHCEVKGDDGLWHKTKILFHDGASVIYKFPFPKSIKYGWTIDYRNFRPLKSDRERWVDMAVDVYKASKKGTYTNCELKCIELIYDAMASGELPTPEAK